MDETRIAASGDLEEGRIAELVAAGAPVDLWGVGTDLGTSRDSPVVNGVYKLVADRRGGGWRGVWKHSPDKETVPGPKQVFRLYEGGSMSADVIAAADEELEGEPLLVPVMRDGEPVRRESLAQIRDRSAAQLAALPERLRRPSSGEPVEPYPVSYSERLGGSTSGR
jgi:nicotinate phosphoribosyltransferase